MVRKNTYGPVSHWVYRCYGADEGLLYVGMTSRGLRRFAEHSLACAMIEEGFGLTDVQAQLGHSNPATTAIYLRGLGADAAFTKVAARLWPGELRAAAREAERELVAA